MHFLKEYPYYLSLKSHVMKNSLNFRSNGPSIYPGEFRPNPFIFENPDNALSGDMSSKVISGVNIFEDDVNYQLEINTPGLRRDDFIVRINKEGNLIISGIYNNEHAFLYHEEKDHSVNKLFFLKEFNLPENIDTDFVRAQCRFGILTVCFLKVEKAYPKRPSMVIVY